MREGNSLQTESPARILIVEDFEDLRKLVAAYLVGRGYHVLQARHGRAAIQTAKSKNPHLILLDIRLPDMNGLDVVRELRKLSQTKHVPIIGWSAESGSNPQREMLRQALAITSRSQLSQRTRVGTSAISAKVKSVTLKSQRGATAPTRYKPQSL